MGKVRVIVKTVSSRPLIIGHGVEGVLARQDDPQYLRRQIGNGSVMAYNRTGRGTIVVSRRRELLRTSEIGFRGGESRQRDEARHRRYNMEVVAQGVANVASAIFGGISVTRTIARTAAGPLQF
jgi:hypothetical protein